MSLNVLDRKNVKTPEGNFRVERVVLLYDHHYIDARYIKILEIDVSGNPNGMIALYDFPEYQESMWDSWKVQGGFPISVVSEYKKYIFNGENLKEVVLLTKDGKISKRIVDAQELALYEKDAKNVLNRAECMQASVACVLHPSNMTRLIKQSVYSKKL